MSIFDLNKSLAPCFLRALYCIALVLITLGLLRGIVGGVRMMSGPPPAAVMAQNTPPAPAAAPASPPGPPAAMPGRPRGPGFGPGRRFGRPPFARPGPMAGPLLRDLPPPVLGGLRILMSLLMAAIMVMLVRVLTEIAGAILAMGAKARG